MSIEISVNLYLVLPKSYEDKETFVEARIEFRKYFYNLL